MNAPSPQYDANGPTEKKVKAGTAAAAIIVGAVLTVLSLIQTDDLIAGWPDWATGLLAVAVAAGSTWLAGYNAPHTVRRDLPPDQR